MRIIRRAKRCAAGSAAMCAAPWRRIRSFNISVCTGRIFCFDFQAPVLQAYMGGLADVQPVSLEKAVKEFHIQT